MKLLEKVAKSGVICLSPTFPFEASLKMQNFLHEFGFDAVIRGHIEIIFYVEYNYMLPSCEPQTECTSSQNCDCNHNKCNVILAKDFG